MIVGLRDYVTRNDFPGVILGLSGGIDSARQGVGSPALGRFERPPALASPTGAVNREV